MRVGLGHVAHRREWMLAALPSGLERLLPFDRRSVGILELRKEALPGRLDRRFKARDERRLLLGRAAAEQHFCLLDELHRDLALPLLGTGLSRLHAAAGFL